MPEIGAWIRSLCFGIAILLTAAPAAAGTPDPALSYRVVDVADDDELNVRQQPGVDGGLLGSLAPDDENVVVTGSVMNVGGSEWWEIVFADADRGWVNGRFLQPMDEEAAEIEYPLLCTGTEPFWSLELEDGEATYSAMGGETLSLSAGPWLMAGGMTGRFAVELEHDGEIGYVGIWREKDFCSDGMSDIRYPFGTILIRPGGEVFAGCCRRAR